MTKAGKVSNFEAQIRRRDGEVIWISENAREVRDDDGGLRYYEGTVEDITDRKNAQDQLLHNALHDKLTGLANRALFSDRLAQAFARLKRHPTAIFAVLFLDFDRFKNINDSLGHMAGDELLVAMGRRLEGCLRPGDTVSRLGGDEFAILLEDVRDQTDATVVAERVQSAMKAPFTLVGQEVFSSVSIGIALAHSGYDNPDDLLRDADMAMYRAKSLGKARHEVFDSGMHTRAVALLQLENRPALGHRAARVRAALSAHHLARKRRHHGHGSPRALAPPRTRPRVARRVHPRRRGNGLDRADRGVGFGNRVRAVGALAGGVASRPAAFHEREFERQAVLAAQPHPVHFGAVDEMEHRAPRI